MDTEGPSQKLTVWPMGDSWAARRRKVGSNGCYQVGRKGVFRAAKKADLLKTGGIAFDWPDRRAPLRQFPRRYGIHFAMTLESSVLS